MRLKPNALTAHLAQGLGPLYHLFGSEILLLEEAVDEIRKTARSQGFAERIRYTVEPGFDWNQLLTSGSSASLFSDKKIIELRIPNAKPGTGGDKALLGYVESMQGNDVVLLIISGGIDKRSQNTKWFKAIEQAGVVLEYPQIGAAQLPSWIEQRMRAQNLRFEPEAAQRLSQFVEGNLLAAAQEINLLALLLPQQTITTEAVENIIADHARFTVYSFVDACLAGAPHRCTRILQGLRREQAEPILILWALTREARTLCGLQAALRVGVSQHEAFRRHGVWSSRSQLVGGALRRLPVAQCQYLLRRLARADLMLKGRAPMLRANIWEEIESIGLRMCGLRIG